MTDINTNTDQGNISPEATDLDVFSADFFSADKSVTPESNSEESDDTSHETDETNAPDEGNETDSEGEADETGESDEEVDQPKGKKKSRFQERIDDLTAKIKEAERTGKDREAALESQLQRALAKLEEISAPKAEDAPQNKTKTSRELVEPTADDLNEDGSAKYPLGEFDPKLLRDLTRYDRAVERAHEAEVAAEAKAEAEQNERLTTIQAEWNTKVTAAKEVYPDYVEKGQTLLDTMGDVNPEYAMYLTQNLMSMEYGPDVFYYLAEHPEEARAIVNSSPEKALNRLGRIEARFEIAALEQSGKETKLRTTQAPEPPATRTKGSNAQVLDDPNDLDAFAKKLFAGQSKPFR